MVFTLFKYNNVQKKKEGRKKGIEVIIAYVSKRGVRIP